VNAAVGRGGLLLEAGEAEGVMEFSVRFRMVIKVDAGISKFGCLLAMRIEMEANCTLEFRALVLDDESMVEVPRRSCSLEYTRSPSPSQVRRRGRTPSRLSCLNYY